MRDLSFFTSGSEGCLSRWSFDLQYLLYSRYLCINYHYHGHQYHLPSLIKEDRPMNIAEVRQYRSIVGQIQVRQMISKTDHRSFNSGNQNIRQAFKAKSAPGDFLCSCDISCCILVNRANISQLVKNEYTCNLCFCTDIRNNPPNVFTVSNSTDCLAGGISLRPLSLAMMYRFISIEEYVLPICPMMKVGIVAVKAAMKGLMRYLYGIQLYCSDRVELTPKQREQKRVELKRLRRLVPSRPAYRLLLPQVLTMKLKAIILLILLCRESTILDWVWYMCLMGVLITKEITPTSSPRRYSAYCRVLSGVTASIRIFEVKVMEVCRKQVENRTYRNLGSRPVLALEMVSALQYLPKVRQLPRKEPARQEQMRVLRCLKVQLACSSAILCLMVSSNEGCRWD